MMIVGSLMIKVRRIRFGCEKRMLMGDAADGGGGGGGGDGGGGSGGGGNSSSRKPEILVSCILLSLTASKRGPMPGRCESSTAVPSPWTTAGLQSIPQSKVLLIPVQYRL